jgi:Holliday junction resolvase RusA-like endonuclease
MVTLRIPLRAFPKERPRFAKGRAFMSARYRRLQAEFRELAQRQYTGEAITSPLRLSCTFSTSTGRSRSDLDNLVGGVMDAIQPWMIQNDRQVVQLWAEIVKGPIEMVIVVEPAP